MAPGRARFQAIQYGIQTILSLTPLLGFGGMMQGERYLVVPT